ncbi:MAG: hypothetical protein V3T08_09475 [Gemmatimonadota bacterium]
MDPFIRYEYLDGRHGRPVEAQCSSAHLRISKGVARPLAGRSTRIYTAWCEGNLDEQPDVSTWEDDGGTPQEREAAQLRDTSIKALANALQDYDDPSVLRSFASADDRKDAGPIYAARMAEIEAGDESAVAGSIEPEAETGGAGGTEAEEGPGGADPEASVAIDLRETPVKRLAEALAEVTDLSVLRALANSDDRSTAAPHYAARIAELEAEEPEAETGDG